MRGIRAAASAAIAIAFSSLWITQSLAAQSGPPFSQATRTPIQHVIVIIGENRSFDNVFGTYIPPNPKQKVWNLLSLGIVNQLGSQGPNASLGAQQQASDTDFYRLNPTTSGPFTNLPQPSTGLNGLPGSPCAVSKFLFEFGQDPAGVLFCQDFALDGSSQFLLSLGGTGQSFYDPGNGIFPVPDCRYGTDLPNDPYSITTESVLNNCGAPFLNLRPPITPTLFTDNTGDPVHRFFQMWQQNDCDISHASASNPSGCLHDLYTWVATSVGWQITKDGNPPTDTEGTFQGGVPMGFYNMAAGDYPYLQWLAQNYAISDNYHQPVMGGTGPNSQFIGTADVFYFTKKGVVTTPPSNLIENPNPQSGSNNFYTNARPGPTDLGSTSSGGLVNCSDPTQPGVSAIQAYLASLPYPAFRGGNCDPGHYYQIDNEYPQYAHNGKRISQDNEFTAGPAFSIGAQVLPTIGDSLSAAGVSWGYYAAGFNQANDPPLANEFYCAICNPFQYTTSIMNSPLKRNIKDLSQFYKDVQAGTLPSVTFVKPDTLTDSHPGTSTPPLYEAFVQHAIEAVQANPKLWKNTAILITFDESGGYYDSGYIQPIDFFGDGPRTVMIAVSPFSKFGYVDHTYADHASIVKFIERNWRLQPLSPRSRDNLPNPVVVKSAPYFPTNSPAIGDLMGMFSFK